MMVAAPLQLVTAITELRTLRLRLAAAATPTLHPCGRLGACSQRLSAVPAPSYQMSG
jgi:hypothetical protein